MYFLNKKAIKSFFVILGLVLLASLIPGCESNQPNLVNPVSSEEGLSKASVVDFPTIETHLNKLMQHLCQSPNILTTERIRRAAERHITLSDLQLDDQFVREFQLKDGNTFEVNIELFQGSSENELSTESTPVYFILDPDRFPGASQFIEEVGGATFQANVAATKLNQSKGLYQNPSSQKQLFLSSKSQKVDYLLFFVGGEEVVSRENEERLYQEMLANRPGLAKALSPTTTLYIWLTGIKPKVDKDYGSDEFELYSCDNPSTYSWYPFHASTALIFDGNTHMDLSGYQRYFPDVNGTNCYICTEHPIAVAWYSDFKLSAIEDDDGKGAHKNAETTTSKHQENGMDIMQISGSICSPSPDNPFGFWYSVLDDVTNDDDIYTDGLIRWLGYNSSPENQHTWYKTNDVCYCLRLGTIYQAAEWGDAPPCPY